MKFLSDMKRILDLVGLNSVQSIEEKRRTRIQRVVARILTIAVVFSCVIGEILFVIQATEKELGTILRPFNFAFAFGCILLIYLHLIGKTKQIGDLIDYIEVFVNDRRC